MAGVIIGVDPHKLSATIEVVDHTDTFWVRQVHHRQGRLHRDARLREGMAEHVWRD